MSDQSSDTMTSTATAATNREERQKRVQSLLWRQVRLLMLPQIDLLDLVMLLQVTLYILMAPYTKVEESFNMQAIHDHLFHGWRIDQYDHFEFPGVVPRTFIGSVFISIFISPIVLVLRWLSSSVPSVLLHSYNVKFLCMILARFTLGLFGICAQGFFRSGITIKFNGNSTVTTLRRKAEEAEAEKDVEPNKDGYRISVWYALLVMCQFHLLFYMGRPLPNMFAMIFAFVAMGYWLRDQYMHMFATLGFAAAIFRSDLLVFIAPVALVCLLTRKIDLFTGMVTGLISVMFGIFVSFLVDTYFWQRLVWPEGELLYYNTVMNKSHEWGVQPLWWYFSSALPRSLLGAVVFVPFGLMFHRYRNQSVLPFFASALLFVCCYSLLPHKELRFIFFALPLFNLTAAVGVVQLKAKFNKLSLLVSLVMIASFVASMFFLYVSSINYYGADALNQLYRREMHNDYHYPFKQVHMDSHVTMNGVTRFSQFTPVSQPNDNATASTSWKYSKREKDVNYRRFSHVLTGNTPDDMHKIDDHFNKLFALVDVQEGFSGIDWKSFQIRKQPKIYCYKRRAFMKSHEPEITTSYSSSIPIEQFMADTQDSLVAPVKWCQRLDKLTLTFELPNLSDIQLLIAPVNGTHQLFAFKAKSSNGNSYLLNTTLYALVDPLDYSIVPGVGKTKVMLTKVTNGEWPRLIQSQTEKPAYIRIDWDNWVDLSKEEYAATGADDDDGNENEFYPVSERHLRDGHGLLQKRLLPLIIQDSDARRELVDDIGSFLDTVAQFYCPPLLFAFLTAFLGCIVLGLFHMTSVVAFLVEQHRGTLEKLKREDELLTKKNK